MGVALFLKGNLCWEWLQYHMWHVSASSFKGQLLMLVDFNIFCYFKYLPNLILQCVWMHKFKEESDSHFKVWEIQIPCW